MSETKVRKTETESKKKSGKKTLIIILSVIAVLAVVTTVVLVLTLGRHSEEYIDEEIEYIDVQTENYYSGIVEPQQTSEIAKDPERTVSTIYVKVGDTVKKGDKLFTYDVDEASAKLAKAKIELESIQNEITEYDNNIAQLTRQRAEADESQQLDYTTQIQAQENEKSQAQLNLKIKQVEIDGYQNNVDNAEVVSPIDGIIKQINNNEMGSSDAFITVLMNGSLRVKCKVDEMNVRMLDEGMSVTVHSRTVKDAVWEGTISKVDTSAIADSGNQEMGFYGESNDSATKYYFYVTLENSDGLLLGEHVYVEPVYSDSEWDYLTDTDFQEADLDAEAFPDKD